MNYKHRLTIDKVPFLPVSLKFGSFLNNSLRRISTTIAALNVLANFNTIYIFISLASSSA